MKVAKYDGSILRKILASMILDDIVVARISSQWIPGGLFDSRWANLIGQWCCEYSTKYSKAPKSEIRGLFESWASSTNEEDAIITSVEDFIFGVSDEEAVEKDFVLDLAKDYFNSVRLKNELEAAQNDLERGFVEDAQKRLQRIRQVELGVGSFVEPAKDFSAWAQAFDTEKRESLVRYPGPVGEFFEGHFLRGEFYSFMGPDKTGKTAYLLDFAYRGIREKNRVAFFDTGDSDQNEVMLRLCSRVTRCPEYARECSIPVKWEEECIFEKKELPSMDPQKGFKMFGKICRTSDAFRLSCHPNTTLSVQGIDDILSDWERQGWRPDILVVDYADILAPPRGVGDPLEQIDETWKQLRKLSQQRHVLLMTATQSNAAAYGNEKGLLSRKNFSGRKTKLAHVNGMIGINVSDEERSTHSGRLNWVVRRKTRNRSRQTYVHIAGCFDLECPIILSKW